MQFQDVLTDVEVVARRGDPTTEVTAITLDSRQVVPGACFACVAGSRTDGHAHAPAAVAAGAVALLVERPLALGVPEAQVVDVRRAVGPVAATLHEHPSCHLRCLGVTGTNGKTTVTYFLEAIARAAGERVGVVGTIEARIDGARVEGTRTPLGHTTPEAPELQALLARMRDAGVRTVAMEVSSHALAQHRVDGVHFAAVGFTNLSRDHLDYHGSVAAYFEAKAALFDVARTEVGAVNMDDELGLALTERAAAVGLATVTFAMGPSSRARVVDFRAEDVHGDGQGARFVLSDRRSGERAEVPLHLPGRANVANALAAAAIARAGGLSFAAVTDGLATLTVVPGRFERIDRGQPFTVLVDYAHTPDALDAVLGTARAMAGGRRVLLVFGSGGDRDRDKRPLMGRVAAAGADLAVLTTDNPRSEEPAAIAAAVLEGLRLGPARVVVEPDRRCAIRLALAEAASGDVVVIAGKGHETGQVAGGVTTPFDDRVVTFEELGAGPWS